MKQINQTAAKIRNAHERKVENTSFGLAPVLATSQPFSKPSTPAIDVTKSVQSVSEFTGSVDENSLVVSMNKISKGTDDDNNSDSESIVTKNKTKRIEQLAITKFELEKCSLLVFIALNGEQTEKLLKYRIVSYSELQREIAKLTPSTKKMYVIQNHIGVRVTAEYFINKGDTSIIRVKEIGIKPNTDLLRALPIKWETEQYHEVTAGQSAFERLNAKDDFSDIMSVDSFKDE